MGASGSGKTTLLNCISTIDKVTSGHIYVGNTDITKLKGNQLNCFRREELGFIFQDFNLLDTMTIEENIALSLIINKEDVKEILISEGYMEFQIGYVLYMFSIRYQDYICGKGKFPHEIGLILGYPAEDVRGFMDNNGKNFLYTGYWKVYKDVDNKVKLFEKFKIAEELLICLLSSGMDMEYIIKACNTGKLQSYVYSI